MSETSWRDLERRWSGPVIASYAQNAEDVRLWRVLGSKTAGFYVDVGAGDPLYDSVTKLFYDVGWAGINIEPGPKYEALERSRPRDINLELAVSSRAGDVELWISWPDPGLSSLIRVPEERLPEGFTIEPKSVPAARLDDLLARHAQGRTIDFLKIDVEGAERDVLSSFDVRSVRPTVVLVEAISPLDNHPTHEQWDHLLLDNEYLFAAFDGVNRFYVPAEHEGLIPALAYPISVLDRFESLGAQRPATGVETELESDAEAHEISTLRAAVDEASAALGDMQNTLSWRITRPLRSVRRLQLDASHRRGSGTRTGADTSALEATFAERLHQVSSLLAPGMDPTERDDSHPADEAVDLLERALASSSVPSRTAAWLVLVAADGTYPKQPTVDTTARVLRTAGPSALGRLVRRRLVSALDARTARNARLDVVEHGVVVDVSEIATSDFHTGIQRVAREAVSHWIREHPALHLAYFDDRREALSLLSERERRRLLTWRSHMSTSESPISSRLPELMSSNTLVPWRCHVIVPELPDAGHSQALRALALSKIPGSLSFICYDLTPIVAAETFPRGAGESFCEYLSSLKCADRISAISQQSADDYRAFSTMLKGEGLRGPEIQAHPLPTVSPERSDSAGAQDDLVDVEEGPPLVLVVGVHEPRKNHVAVLEAAERLWKSRLRFELLFIGGSGWSDRAFDRYVHELQSAAWPVTVRKRASEAELWAAYRRARFTVFPSLLEGFGLPVAESLVVGTPVITSAHGSMAEIGSGGGALLVDPRRIDEIEREMRRLLEDDGLLERLQREALDRDFGSWEAYAREIWDFFTREASEIRT